MIGNFGGFIQVIPRGGQHIIDNAMLLGEQSQPKNSRSRAAAIVSTDNPTIGIMTGPPLARKVISADMSE